MIDMISKEAILLNHAKLKKAKIKTIPYVSDITNKETGIRTAHACMIFHYRGDTWHYDNCYGSVKVFVGKLSNSIPSIAKKVFSLRPHLKLHRAFPLDIQSNFKAESQPLPKKYIFD